MNPAGGLLIPFLTGFTMTGTTASGRSVTDSSQIKNTEILQSIIDSMGNLPNLVKTGIITTATDISAVNFFENNKEYVYNTLKAFDFKTAPTTITIDDDVYKVMKTWAKALSKGWINDTIDASVEYHSNIGNVTNLSDALGYPSSQFTRSDNPSPPETWASLCAVYHLLNNKVPILKISLTPNTNKNIVGEESNLLYPSNSSKVNKIKARSRNDYFIYPAFEKIKYVPSFYKNVEGYPLGGSRWNTIKRDNGGTVIFNDYVNAFNEGVTSEDLIKCITGVTRVSGNNTFRINLNTEKLRELGITGLVELGVKYIFNSDTQPGIGSFISSEQVTNVGSGVLEEFDKKGKYRYAYNTSGEPFNVYYKMDDVLYYRMDSVTPYNKFTESDKENKIVTTNITDPDVANPDWYITVEGLSLVGGNVREKAKFRLTPSKNLKQAIEDGNIDMTSAGTQEVTNTDGQTVGVAGDRTVSIPDAIGSLIDGVLTGTRDLAGVIGALGNSLVNTLTRTDAFDSTKTLEDTIKDANSKNNGTSITPTVPIGKGVGASDFVTIWLPTDEQISQIASILWSDNFLTNIKKLVADPMDAIISYQQIPIWCKSAGSKILKLGNFNTNLSVNRAYSQYTSKNMGSVYCDLKYNNFLDYDYTIVQLFLPFIGFVTLDTRETMGHTISVIYSAELMTGSCLVSVRSDNSIIGTYTGQISLQIPITGQNYSRAYGAVMSSAVQSALTPASAISAIPGVLSAIGDSLEKSGNFSVNSGFLGSYQPYLILGRPIANVSNNFPQVMGYANNVWGKIGTFSGYCQFENVKLGGSGLPKMTMEQADRIRAILSEGVFI